MSFALFFIDLDGFKKVNDTLGHGVGDEAIRAAGRRIQTCLREGDTLARLGGDEFAILVEDLSGEIPQLGERIREVLRAPFVLGVSVVNLTASIGVVEAATGHESTEDLLRYADLAMYRAKERSGDQVRLFDRSLSAEAARRFEVEGALRYGIDHGELVVYYQPVVELSTGALTGVEALVRWVHPERGILLPAEFIPIAEETGLIITLGNEVLRIATQDVAGWIDRGEVDSDFSLAVNVSARQIARSDFADGVRDQLVASGLSASRLILEITETALLDDSEALRVRLKSLRESGIRVALDDFGVGYSSLQRLSSMPVDVVKIDRSFVLGIAQRDDLVSLVRAMLELASSFGYEAVAEGIEAVEDSEALQTLGCHLGQGFGLFRPAPAEAIRALLATHVNGATLTAV
jgi:diguanylate cyclase (GGDEF)-like protein